MDEFHEVEKRRSSDIDAIKLAGSVVKVLPRKIVTLGMYLFLKTSDIVLEEGKYADSDNFQFRQ